MTGGRCGRCRSPFDITFETSPEGADYAILSCPSCPRQAFAPVSPKVIAALLEREGRVRPAVDPERVLAMREGPRRPGQWRYYQVPQDAHPARWGDEGDADAQD